MKKGDAIARAALLIFLSRESGRGGPFPAEGMVERVNDKLRA
jgi:hypothetical protein